MQHLLVAIILWQEVCEIIIEINDGPYENNADNCGINNNKKTTSKSFEYKAKVIGRAPIKSNTSDAKFVVPLKYLSNFWEHLIYLWLSVK